MAFEIEEVEVAEYDPIKMARTLYPNLDLFFGLEKLSQEFKQRKTHDEFWSDVCWVETP